MQPAKSVTREEASAKACQPPNNVKVGLEEAIWSTTVPQSSLGSSNNAAH